MSFLSLNKFLFPGFFLICKPECWADAVLLTGFSTILMVFNSKVLGINFKKKGFFLFIYLFEFHSSQYALHKRIYVVICKCLHFIFWNVCVDNH